MAHAEGSKHLYVGLSVRVMRTIDSPNAMPARIVGFKGDDVLVRFPGASADYRVSRDCVRVWQKGLALDRERLQRRGRRPKL